ncbi:hypothetical protein TWF679_002284 [Orbilia oligospora]|uniref:Uncharacterized protein n=1 Tax=Orbilia oligospora TaxID=2813651 RepID=A0A8H8VGE1_ORBOL|nr:hypothetical protein TWF679_002284 [Orbilia oligospora]
MAMIPKPKEHDLQKRERAIIVIFGEEQDPDQLDFNGLYEKMRADAKDAYREVIKPENKDNTAWKLLPPALKQRAINRLLEIARTSPEGYYTYFERSQNGWLPEYLLRSYSRYHINHVTGARKMSTAVTTSATASTVSFTAASTAPPTSINTPAATVLPVSGSSTSSRLKRNIELRDLLN